MIADEVVGSCSIWNLTWMETYPARPNQKASHSEIRHEHERKGVQRFCAHPVKFINATQVTGASKKRARLAAPPKDTIKKQDRRRIYLGACRPDSLGSFFFCLAYE